MEAKAVLRTVRIAPRKVRLVLDLIRGRNVDEAIVLLNTINKAASEPILKLLNSVVANAVNNLGLNRESLYIKEVYAGEGPTLKRYRPRARGSASPINKRTSHIYMTVAER
jgi:large subunit ribosomal protein L22